MSKPSVSTKVITGRAKASQVLTKRAIFEVSSLVSLSFVLFVATMPTVCPLIVASAVYEALPVFSESSTTLFASQTAEAIPAKSPVYSAAG